VRELVRRSAERDDEGQIVKELQRGRPTMRLVRVTARQRSAPMASSEANFSHAAILPGALLREAECCQARRYRSAPRSEGSHQRCVGHSFINSRTRGMTWRPYSSMLVIRVSWGRPPAPYFRSKRVAPSMRRLAAIFWATISGDPT
jgi:hypothetical protein